MTKANTMVIAKMAAAVAAIGLVVSAFAFTANAQSASACASFNRDLTIGATGADVTALQNWLIGKGFTIAAGATGYFGGQTQAALARYQASVSISPAAGYFGPITRAKVGASCDNGGGSDDDDDNGDDDNDDGLQGGEGTLNVEGNLGDVEDEVEEDEEDVQVLGVELEAEDSDIELERVDVDFDLSDAATGESSNLDDYITEVSLWLDGEEIARLDVDEADEDDNDIFSFRFTDLDSAVIDEDETGELYVAVNAVGNIDSGDTDVVLTVDIEADGIRAVDAEGISETYATEGEITAETFSVVEATTGDVSVSTSADSPDAQTLVVDEDDDTDDVTILAFDIEADEQDIVVDEIPVGITTSETDLDQVISRAMLVMDGDVLDTVSVSTTAENDFVALFEDLDLEIEEGEEVTLEVVVDINDTETGTFDSGTTISATTTGSHASWDVEDANGEEVTPSGSAQGDTMTLVSSGIVVMNGATTAQDDDIGTSGSEEGTFTITFDVEATEGDFYIYKGADVASSTSAGVIYTVYQDGSASTTVVSSGQATDDLDSASENGDTSDYFLVREGDTREFTLTVNLNPLTTGFYKVELEAVRYDASEDNSSEDDSTLTVPDEEEFETDSIQLNA